MMEILVNLLAYTFLISLTAVIASIAVYFCCVILLGCYRVCKPKRPTPHYG